jgi:uncharacterized membrane protein YdbT with pleckstrin-like domain
MNETTRRMHWWFFVERAVPWLLAAVMMLGLFYLTGFAAGRIELPNGLYGRVRFSILAIIAVSLVLSLLGAWIVWLCTRLEFDDGYLVYSKGVLNRTVAKVPVQEIASIDVHQTLLQRMLGAGDLVIDMRGASLLRIRLMPDPSAIQGTVLDMRRPRGTHFSGATAAEMRDG